MERIESILQEAVKRIFDLRIKLAKANTNFPIVFCNGRRSHLPAAVR